MCNKVILENSRILKFFPDCYKIKKTCNIAVDNYVHAIEFVPNCYKTQKMCKAINTCPSAIQLIPERYKSQEMSDKAVAIVLLYLILLLVNIRLNKYVIKSFLKILLF